MFFGRKEKKEREERERAQAEAAVKGSVTQAVAQLVYASSFDEAKKVVESQQNWLLTDLAEFVVDQSIDRYQGDDSMVERLILAKSVIEACREEGIDKAFDGLA